MYVQNGKNQYEVKTLGTLGLTLSLEGIQKGNITRVIVVMLCRKTVHTAKPYEVTPGTSTPRAGQLRRHQSLHTRVYLGPGYQQAPQECFVSSRLDARYGTRRNIAMERQHPVLWLMLLFLLAAATVATAAAASDVSQRNQGQVTLPFQHPLSTVMLLSSAFRVVRGVRAPAVAC